MFNSRSLLSFLILIHGTRALSQPVQVRTEKSNQRRAFFKAFVPSFISLGYVAAKPEEASANAVSSGVPLVGRFEELKGANSFIGVWSYTATKGIKEGDLVFLKNGDVELRSADDSSTVIGVGAVPWKYVSPKGADTMVTVTFTLDEDDQDNVLIFQGTMDVAGGLDRTLEGEISTGRAEIGARGNGPLKKAGSFKAQFKTTEISCPK
uniref:Uncharacterized protein n=1 Tax=Chaetoceros debilis TaxID=122233 RepID=A0A7S3QJ92_9STRA|mmetsp:Transcript_21217/g.32237  ORF Transcript_21217/g.32237 Transcript_21217/m.32237 type:complete len:208 (+) Transcript_21217:155-778(+)|eukprot:CAMPEP_0194088968 /NCGR_PEP_ID=MMETSP0149-20130528/31973_1 /TAXON_ID=122233 /ORGANISM="Chaetoceros debilis, Strain MM31A-1" /LENGTH=207 /DNA_ID=CAMNT_0038772745 /DNA_START=87 /DNA_END=710 /DNA_ORIENTATION=-